MGRRTVAWMAALAMGCGGAQAWAQSAGRVTVNAPGVSVSVPAGYVPGMFDGVPGAAAQAQGGAAAAYASRSGNGLQGEMACSAQGGSVAGNGNRIVVRGWCPLLRVSGNDNEVWVDQAGQIATDGNGNKVYWKSGPGGAAPAWSNSGNGNAAIQARW